MTQFNRRSLFTLLGSTASALTLGKVAKADSAVKATADFDYIIVGSGAGGGPLAVNLAKAGFKTLLLEAGTDQGKNPSYEVPAFHAASTEDPQMAWDFYVDHFKSPAANQADAKYVKGQGILYPRAGTVGGCTAHNAMITVYPLAKDWEQLGEDVGDKTYNAKTMRKYFGLCERAEYSKLPERKKGWLPINLASPLLALHDKAVVTLLFSAWRKLRKDTSTPISAIESILQLVSNPDTNADTLARDTTEGLVMIPAAITAEGKRYSTRDLIMSQVGKNLTLRTSCLVTKVLFDETGAVPVATGVEYLVGDTIYQASKSPNPASAYRTQVYAKHEVILAGGTFNTPQLLMASGIGPKEHLETFTQEDSTFRVLLDRPGVGENLQDRYEIGVVSKADDPLAVTADCQFKPSLSDPCFAQWTENAGPYTSNGAAIGILKKSRPDLTNPDLFMLLLPSDFRGYFPGYSKAIATSKYATTWAIIKSHTENRGGTVRLKNLDPTSRPLINFNYFEDGTDADGNLLSGNTARENADLEAVVTGIEFVREINQAASTTLAVLDISADLPEGPAGFEDRYFEEVLPGKAFNKRSLLREWVRRNSWGHHAVGTCKMGHATDPMAVVDHKFRVIGTSGLRIVDASVFPRIPGYFIATSIYTMSERATDEILEQRGLPRRISLD